MKKLIISTLAVLALSGCSSPKDEATEIAQKACLADKNSDMRSMAKYVSADILEENKQAHKMLGNGLKAFLKMQNCDVENTKKAEDGRFVVSFKKHSSYIVGEINGDLKVVEDMYF
ncbi:lipoprotein [Pseudoalteromonas sp. S983]|uniref:lipoprotein n=1 Tax=Pseudoalteromonas sp. S983 TaxID=579572 RepID=UPI00110B443F|nr:lipoprotein [Pseudoalteromonas sp. S983]TMP77691.1 hypothetical protein CWB71_19280 [Pseudoalteromonas sp. S983]